MGRSREHADTGRFLTLVSRLAQVLNEIAKLRKIPPRREEANLRLAGRISRASETCRMQFLTAAIGRNKNSNNRV